MKAPHPSHANKKPRAAARGTLSLHLTRGPEHSGPELSFDQVTPITQGSEIGGLRTISSRMSSCLLREVQPIANQNSTGTRPVIELFLLLEACTSIHPARRLEERMGSRNNHHLLDPFSIDASQDLSHLGQPDPFPRTGTGRNFVPPSPYRTASDTTRTPLDSRRSRSGNLRLRDLRRVRRKPDRRISVSRSFRRVRWF